MNQLAIQKTEVIKSGDFNDLNNLIIEEKKHIQAIQKIEKKLFNETEHFLKLYGITSEKLTLTDCIEISSNEEKQILIEKKSDLAELVIRLKQQNSLNQQLLEQSLQFVNISLDMLLPAIDSFNYEHPNQTTAIGEDKRSIFDSKA